MTNVIQRPLAELSEDYWLRRANVQEVVLGELDEEKILLSVFCAFGADRVVDGEYVPPEWILESGEFCAATGDQWRRRSSMGVGDIGHHAARQEVPAVGVFDVRLLEPRERALHWRTKSGISILQTCTDVFVWNE